MKKVSVIVTCYNHEAYIEQCLRSIFNQTHQELDLIIINDGSTDNSDEIIRQTIVDSPFAVTEYIVQENEGSCASRNKGLDWATGDFILMVDSDNYIDADHIEKSLDLLEETGKDIAYTSLRDADTGEIINEVPEFDLTSLINVNYIDTCSLIRRSVLKTHRFDLYLNRLFMQDYDFFLGLIHDGAQAIKVDQLYQNYRVLPNSVGNRVGDRESRVKWFQVYTYINDKYPEYNVSASRWFSNWYLELNEDYDQLVKKMELANRHNYDLALEVMGNQRLLVAAEREALESTRKYNELSDSFKQVVHSSSWKVGRATTFPLRRVKTLLAEKPKPEEEPVVGVREKTPDDIMYENWINDTEDMEKRLNFKRHTVFEMTPKISVLIPVYNVEEKWLEKCIQSVRDQWYPNWEICIADDASTQTSTLDYLKKLVAADDEQVKVVFRTENGHISEATNSALEIASGEFIALLDNDDELAPDALFEVVKKINYDPEATMVYTDEDKVDVIGTRFDPHFKPDWSPDLILNQNYISHLGVYRTDIAREIGGFRKGFEGVQDHDFVLRFTEKVDSGTIKHVPVIGYHWRAIVGSTALDTDEKDYVSERGIKAIEEALERRGIKGTVKAGVLSGLYDIEYEIMEEDLVSIIIPTRNGLEDLKACVDSIVEKSTYSNYEIVIADNGSDDPEIFELFKEYKKQLGERFVRVFLDIPFNYSRINNKAVAASHGKYLIFLNNDTSIITPNWIEEMLGFAQFERVGCVGAKLWYYDDTIQHAGVIVGLGGVAGHSFTNSEKDQYGYFRRLYTDYNYTAVTAACLMVSRKNFDAVHGFDENLAVAFNDVDFCIRVFELGRNNVWAHKAELYHYESKSRGYENTPEKQERFNGEIRRMRTKYGEFLFNDPAYNINFSLDVSPFTLIGR